MNFDATYFNIGILDRLSYKDTAVHRLDPRTKVIAVFALIVAVVSFPKYEVADLVPFFLFPVAVFALADIPVRFILKKVLLASSFAVLVGLFNPLLDTRIMYRLWGVPISGGWVSFLSILLKFFLTVSSMLLLIATTSFPAISYALGRLGVPAAFVSQLDFLYRYIFVLLEESMRMVRSRDLRAFGRRGRGLAVTVNLIGVLFMRTVGRAERIHNAMLSRGFSGTVRLPRRRRMRTADIACLAVVAGLLALFRFCDVIHVIGTLASRMF